MADGFGVDVDGAFDAAVAGGAEHREFDVEFVDAVENVISRVGFSFGEGFRRGGFGAVEVGGEAVAVCAGSRDGGGVAGNGLFPGGLHCLVGDHVIGTAGSIGALGHHLDKFAVELLRRWRFREGECREFDGCAG